MHQLPPAPPVLPPTTPHLTGSYEAGMPQRISAMPFQMCQMTAVMNESSTTTATQSGPSQADF